MATEIAVGSFLSGVGAATSTVSVSGLGFTPNLVLAFASGAGSDADETHANFGHMVFGAATSSSNRACASWAVRRAYAAKGEVSASCILNLFGTDSGSKTGTLDFSSMDADGFTLVVDEQPDTTLACGYMAIKCTNAKVGTTALRTDAGDQSVTGVGFQPGAVLFFAAGAVPVALDTATNSGAFMVGAAGSTTLADQCVVTSGMRDRSSGDALLGDCYGISGECLALFNATQGMVARAHLKSFDADGFTLTVDEASGTAPYFCWVALDADVDLDIVEFETSTSVETVNVTGSSIQPNGAIILSCGQDTEHASDTPASTNLFYNLGFIDGSLNARVLAMYGDEGNNDNDASAGGYRTGECQLTIVHPSTVAGYMAGSSLENDGFVLSQADGDTVTRYSWAVLLGPLGINYPITLAGVLTFNDGDATDRDNLVLNTNKVLAGALTLAGVVATKIYRFIQGFIRGIADPTANVRGHPNPSQTIYGLPDPDDGTIQGSKRR